MPLKLGYTSLASWFTYDNNYCYMEFCSFLVTITLQRLLGKDRGSVVYFIAMATLTCIYVSCNAIRTPLAHMYSTRLATVKHPNTQLWSCWLVADKKAITGHCHTRMNTSMLMLGSINAQIVTSYHQFTYISASVCPSVAVGLGL